MRNPIKYLLAALLFAWSLSPDLTAQFSNTYYHMFGIPQANQLNPAFQPGCDGYLAMPLIGPLRFNLETNGLRYGDIFEYNSNIGKNITFMHPLGNSQKFLDALKPVNVIRAEMISNILSFGWRKEQFFFTFDLSERLVQRASFNKDFAEFLIHGNLNQDQFNFSDVNEEVKYFHQIALGVSYNMDDEMLFGARIKLLLGGANISARNSNINLNTSVDEWRFNSQSTINVSVPFLENENIPVDKDGYLIIDSIEDPGNLLRIPGSNISEWLNPGTLKTLGGVKNPGIAIDFGFSYMPVEKLNVSASVIDLGFIRWKNYVYNFEQDMEYTFKGIEIGPDFFDSENGSPGGGLLDSLKSSMKIRVTQNKYTTALAGRVYLGASYDLTEKVRFGGVFRTRIYNYKFYNQYTASINVQPISMFSASLSYSIYGQSYKNLGLGLSLRLGPLNLYFITDQAPSAYFWPQDFTSLNFRFGLNIVWGCNALPKAMKDRPLID